MRRWSEAIDAAKLAALDTAKMALERDFGNWRVACGRINHFQRLDNQIAPHFFHFGAVGFARILPSK